MPVQMLPSCLSADNLVERQHSSEFDLGCPGDEVNVEGLGDDKPLELVWRNGPHVLRVKPSVGMAAHTTALQHLRR